MEAIQTLGYRRNNAARALVTRRSGVIGVVVSGLGYSGQSSAVVGLEAAARSNGYSLILTSLAELTPQATRNAIDHLVAESVEALVMIVPEALEMETLDSGLELPVVVLDSDPARARLSVGVDHTEGARMATQHLLDLGHRRIAHISGPTDWYQAKARVRGWTQALQSAECEVPSVLVGDWTPESGYAQGKVLARDPDVTAVFVANDQMSIGVIRAMVEAGRRVPQDVSITGFDDIPESEFLLPPLTTIRQDFGVLGGAALGLLLGALQRGQAEGAISVPPKLVVRGSTSRLR